MLRFEHHHLPALPSAQMQSNSLPIMGQYLPSGVGPPQPPNFPGLVAAGLNRVSESFRGGVL